MSLYPPPACVDADVWTRMPASLRLDEPGNDWAVANKPGERVDCFLEGPSFDRDGHLWLVDIPHGRVFSVDPHGEWRLRARYDGWPNGLKIHRDGRIFIADYRRGILELDPDTGTVRSVISHRYSESFRGCNDLCFADNGDLYFTDQGQSGLHQPDGRVFRYDTAGRLSCLISNAPSPNGLVMNDEQSALLVAMTRGNCVWRLPLMADGGVSKVGLFVQLSGGLSGPDGLALAEDGALAVAHAGNGCVWIFDRLGCPLERVVSPAGLTTTNLAYGGPDARELYITESATGSVLRARVQNPGRTPYSHR